MLLDLSPQLRCPSRADDAGRGSVGTDLLGVRPATHPYAGDMSGNAESAQTGLHRLPEGADELVTYSTPAGSENYTAEGNLKKKYYENELARLQEELVKLQYWVQQNGKKVAIIFEGRGTAGKGGVIKRITERTSPRSVRVAALPVPTEREKTQWYFQRYVAQLPAAGEIVLFDRSWSHRSNVEWVMGFCTQEEYQEFVIASY